MIVEIIDALETPEEEFAPSDGCNHDIAKAAFHWL
jgi:hypothetical protein